MSEPTKIARIIQRFGSLPKSEQTEMVKWMEHKFRDEFDKADTIQSLNIIWTCKVWGFNDLAEEFESDMDVMVANKEAETEHLKDKLPA